MLGIHSEQVKDSAIMELTFETRRQTVNQKSDSGIYTLIRTLRKNKGVTGRRELDRQDLT